MGTFLISCKMPHFSLIFVPLNSVQGDERYEHKVEECFLLLLCFPRAPGTPPAPAIHNSMLKPFSSDHQSTFPSGWALGKLSEHIKEWKRVTGWFSNELPQCHPRGSGFLWSF